MRRARSASVTSPARQTGSSPGRNDREELPIQEERLLNGFVCITSTAAGD